MAKTNPKSTNNKWNLQTIFKKNDSFEKTYAQLETLYTQYLGFKKTMLKSPAQLADCLDFNMNIELELEKIGSFAFLKHSENLNDTKGQELINLYTSLAYRIGEASSFIVPQIASLDSKKYCTFMEHPRLKIYNNYLNKIKRQKKHILSQKEERILALVAETSRCAAKVYRQLSDADMKFGKIKTPKGHVELTHGSFTKLLENPNPKVRKAAFETMFKTYGKYAGTIATAYAEQVKQNIVWAKIRKFTSARAMMLYDDNVSEAIYDNIIKTVCENIHINYRFLDLQKKFLKQKKLYFYDTYISQSPKIKWDIKYEEAVDIICEATSPLGSWYCQTMKKGLTTRQWVDRYEAPGKQSGAFSAGGYKVPPFILMNYRSDTLSGIYTLAHEAGHSMHTLLSAQNQPFPDYEYTIFSAEVASTFNEQLLTRHLLRTAKDKAVKKAILLREINQIRSTMIRQTMFAHFERTTHQVVENNQPLTLDRLNKEYKDILSIYFGKHMVINDLLALEWARIPHFYNSFYVYKYATGIAAALTLEQLVSEDKKYKKARYLSFLKAGCSKFPLELLADAGADMSTPKPIIMAMNKMEYLLGELEKLN